MVLNPALYSIKVVRDSGDLASQLNVSHALLDGKYVRFCQAILDLSNKLLFAGLGALFEVTDELGALTHISSIEFSVKNGSVKVGFDLRSNSIKNS